jgi:hypothetical protein
MYLLLHCLKKINMKIKLLSIICLALAIGSCRKANNDMQTGDKPNVAAAAKTARPFSGTMTYHFTTDFDLACTHPSTIPAGNYLGAGNLSHLGATTSKFEPCIVPLFSGNNVIGLHVMHVCGSFVASNGDEVYCSSRPYDLMFTNTGAVGSTTIDFAGGTGRFANASGTITGIVTNDNSGNSVLSNINGTISY